MSASRKRDRRVEGVPRPRNQDRVVDPDRDERLRAISECVARSGYPAELSDILAEGFVARLRRRVYAALSDVIGTGDDLEALAGWKGSPRSLAAAMRRAGYVRDIQGVCVMVDAINEAPEYLKKRWQRSNRQSYDAAVKRGGQPNIVNRPYGVPGDDDDYDYDAEALREDDMQNQKGLFGDDNPTAEREKHVARNPGFSEASAAWAQLYEQAEGRKYTWRGRCNRHVADILKLAGSVADFERIAAAYLADRSNFYAGHELRILARDFIRFQSLAEQHRRSAGRHAANRSGIATDKGRRRPPAPGT
jgi:hypothetical protein